MSPGDSRVFICYAFDLSFFFCYVPHVCTLRLQYVVMNILVPVKLCFMDSAYFLVLLKTMLEGRTSIQLPLKFYIKKKKNLYIIKSFNENRCPGDVPIGQTAAHLPDTFHCSFV